MANDKEKTEQAFKDLIYAQLGIAAEINDKITEKIDAYVARGKDIAEKNRDLDEEIRRTIEREKGKEEQVEEQVEEQQED